MDREQKKKLMTSAGISATGLGAVLLLGAFNVIDVNFLSGVMVAVSGWLAATIYTIFKGPSDDGGTGA